jgi:probable HAF family extracellular repeat protein
MRSSFAATRLLSLTTILLAACSDAPTAPVAPPEPTAIETQPSETVANTNTLFQLGALSGFANGGVNAINTAGETAGWNNVGGGAYHAFIRGLDGAMTDLGTLGGSGSIALAMNDSKTVVGLSYIAGNTTYHAFVSEISGTRPVNPVELPVLTGTTANTTRCAAYGVNDNGGSIVGFCYAIDGKQHAVRWTRVTATTYTIKDLQPATGWTSTFAYDINDGGTVVGFGTTGGLMRAFKYVPTSPLLGTMTSLGVIAGGTSSTARAINNLGDIVGWGTTSTGQMHALGIYSATPATIYDLGASTTGSSFAFDINDNDQAVGWAQTSTGVYDPLFWNAAITPSSLGTLSSSAVAQAQGINDRGQVVGTSITTTANAAVMWFTKTANTIPVANAGGPYTITRSSGKAVLTLDASASADVDGDLINGYSWTFSDGGSATGVKPTHTYTAAGSYTVSLTITDWRGGTSLVVQGAVTVK